MLTTQLLSHPLGSLNLKSYLGVVERVDEVLVIENVSLRLKQQFEDAVLDGFQLRLVGVNLDNQLVPLFFQIRPLQTHHVAVTATVRCSPLLHSAHVAWSVRC